MNKKTCLIILPYIENISSKFLKKLVAGSDLIICADAGQEVAAKHNIKVSAVIGDLDSSNCKKLLNNTEYIIYPKEKDITDAEAAILYAESQAATDIIFLGGIGGRLDHTLGIISILEKYFHKFASIAFLDEKNYITIFEKEISIFRNPLYKYFSLFTLNDIATDLTINGAKYNLTNAELSRKSTLCISNEFNSDKVTISSKSAPLLLVRSSDK